MHQVPRVLFAIMFAVLLITLHIRLAGWGRPAVGPSYSSAISPTPTPNSPSGFGGLEGLFSEGATQSSSVDLRGPWVCSHQDAQMGMNVKIHDKKIFVVIDAPDNKQRILVRDDSLYMWDYGTYRGTKVPGVGQYLEMFENFSAFLPSSMLFSLIPSFASSEHITKEMIDGMRSSCKKEEIPPTVFEMPRGVTFVELSPTQIPADTP